MDNSKFPILYFFKSGHLPQHLRVIAQPFEQTARKTVEELRDTQHPQELAAGLRKLLEAKDCAVRAALNKPSGA